jgi:beta-glucanase (GH16 family)
VWGTPVFSDDFSGSSVDRSKWGVYNDPDGQHPRVPEAVRVANGELRLTESWYDSAGKYASGGLASKFSQLYGRWEVRFRVDAAGGSSAVVLLWPTSERWPTDGEIDGIEVGGGDRQSGGAFVHNGASHLRAVGGVDADFTKWHTITIDWLPDSVTFYLDGRQYFRETRRAYIPSTSRMFLGLQLDVMCDEWNECRDGSTPDDVVMHIDYVRIYAY